MSVVIPVFNGADYVRDAVASVLSQDYPVVECIVVDDGSTDGSGGAAAVDPSVRVIRTENRGVSAARNRGAREARGELLAFLDADDHWDPSRLSACAAALDSAPEAAALLCSMRLVDEQGESLGHLHANQRMTPNAMLLRSTAFPPSSSCMLVKREAFERIGGFDPNLSTSADWDLTLRLVEDDGVACIDRELVTYRIREGSMSSDISLMASDMRLAYKKAFERRPHPVRFRRKAWARLFRMLSGSHFESSRDPRAFGYAVASMALDPRLAPLMIRSSFRRLRGEFAGAPAPYV